RGAACLRSDQHHDWSEEGIFPARLYSTLVFLMPHRLMSPPPVGRYVFGCSHMVPGDRLVDQHADNRIAVGGVSAVVVPDIHNQTLGILHSWEDLLEVCDHLVCHEARQIDVQDAVSQLATLELLAHSFWWVEASRQRHLALGSAQALDAQNGPGTVFAPQQPQVSSHIPALWCGSADIRVDVLSQNLFDGSPVNMCDLFAGLQVRLDEFLFALRTMDVRDRRRANNDRPLARQRTNLQRQLVTSVIRMSHGGRDVGMPVM